MSNEALVSSVWGVPPQFQRAHEACHRSLTRYHEKFEDPEDLRAVLQTASLQSLLTQTCALVEVSEKPRLQNALVQLQPGLEAVCRFTETLAGIVELEPRFIALIWGSIGLSLVVRLTS